MACLIYTYEENIIAIMFTEYRSQREASMVNLKRKMKSRRREPFLATSSSYVQRTLIRLPGKIIKPIGG